MSDLKMLQYISGIENDFLEGNIPSDYSNNRVSKIGDYGFYGVSNIENVKFDNVEYVGNSAFTNCSHLKNVSLPKCKYIGDDAFSGCASLENFDFLNTCEILGSPSSKWRASGIFYGCSNFMSELNLSKLKVINDYAFYSDQQTITKIDLPNCEHIGSSAFYGCCNISYVNLPKCEYIGTDAYTYQTVSKIKYMNLQNIKHIEIALHSILSLPSESFIFNSDVEYIGSAVFFGDYYTQQQSSVTYSKLSYIGGSNWCLFDPCETVNLPECLDIGDRLFDRNNNITNVNLPKCKMIRHSVFYSCSKITSIDLPECQSILDNAFEYCSNLSEINIPNCSGISAAAFHGCSNLKSINLPACSTLSPYTWGVYYGIFEGCSDLSIVSLPICRALGSSTFKNCTSLSYIDLPACGNLDKYAFGYCSNLEIIKFGASAMTWYSTSYIFYGCSKIREVYFSNLTNIPYVYSSTIFPTNSLEHIYVPASMVSVFLNHSRWSYYSSYISGIY